MADHSQKWHDGSSSRSVDSNNNSKGIAAIVRAHLDKECPINKEVKSMKEVKYGEFGCSSPFNNGAKYRVGPPGYYTRIDNRPPFGEKRPSLEDLLNKHLEESIRRRAEMGEWIKKLQENTKINSQNQSAFLKNLETQIEQLTKEFHAKLASEISNSSVGQCKAVYKEPINNTSSNETNQVSFIANDDTQEEYKVPTRVLPCQLPPKELNPRRFTLPCTIGNLNFYAMADLGASVNVIPKSIFKHLKLAKLKRTDMLVEMPDMTKRTPIGIVQNILVKIDKFLFPSDFIVMDMLRTHNETVILGIPFLATIHAKINVFNKEISLVIRDDKGDNAYWWHDHGLEDDERQEIRVNIEEYDPPKVYVEAFEVRRYSFDSGQSFICVTSELKDTLPLGRENGSRFIEMIRNELDIGGKI
ncbi:reverse transcriptase domain-containing protein [Tanacetum coccineum]